jgi:single-stranded DNA-binding protein
MSKAGKPFCTFSVVVALGAEATQWLQVAAFGETAEALAGLPTGTSIYVEGHLRLETFERKDGTTATQLKVSASVALPLGQIGNRRRPAPPRKAAKKPDPQAPLRPAEHGGPNDPMPF